MVEESLNDKKSIGSHVDFSKPRCVAGFSYKTISEMAEDTSVSGYGFIEIEDDSVEWYEYDGDIVSASLLVNENGQWIRVYSSCKSVKVKYDNNRVYNLITEDGNIVYRGKVYRDYLETHDKDVWNLLLKQLDNYHNR
jgi:hypothetical protein